MLASYLEALSPDTFNRTPFKVSNEQVKRELMTLLELAQEEGRQEGRQEGQLIGKIQLCENLLGRPTRPSEALTSLSFAELERELARLEQQVKSRWKPN